MNYTLNNSGIFRNLLGTRWFQWVPQLVKVEIPEGITKIEISCFNECLALTEVKLPHSLQQLGNYAFMKTNLSSVTLYENVQIIGDAFTQCSNLTTLNLYSTALTSNYPFSLSSFLSSNLSVINSYVSTAPPIFRTSDSWDQQYLPKNGTFYYPSGSNYSSWATTLGLDGWTGSGTL